MSKKLLVVRFSSIGDIVLTSPILRVLNNAGHEIHFLTKSRFAGLLENNPHIRRIYSLEEEKLIDELKKENFDHLIDLHNNIRTVTLAFKLRLKRSSFPKINLQKWLAVRGFRRVLPKNHIVDRYFCAIKILGLVNDGKGLEFYAGKTDLSNLNIPKGKYLVWVIGGAHATKCYPEDLVRKSIEQFKNNVVIIGGPDDRAKGERISNGLSHVFNLAGKCSINQSATIIQQSEMLVSNDTGMMHIAAAYEKPIVALWGNTIPEFGMFPYKVQNKDTYNLELEGLNCRPCSKIGFDKCPKGHHKCMRQIQPDKIAQIISKLAP